MSRIALSNIANTDSVKTNNKRSMVSTNLTQSTIQERDASSASSSSSSSDPFPKKRKLVTHIQDNEKEGHDGRSTDADYLLPCPSQFQQVINPSMFTQKLIIYCHAGEHSVNANGFNEKNHRAITLCMGKEVQFVLKNDVALLVHPLQLLNSVTNYDKFNHKGHGKHMIHILDGVLGEDFKKGNSYDNNYQAFKSLKKTYEYYFDVSEVSDVSELDVKMDQKNQQKQNEDDDNHFEMLEKNTQDTICLRGKSVEPDALLNAIDLHGGIEVVESKKQWLSIVETLHIPVYEMDYQNNNDLPFDHSSIDLLCKRCYCFYFYPNIEIGMQDLKQYTYSLQMFSDLFSNSTFEFGQKVENQTEPCMNQTDSPSGFVFESPMPTIISNIQDNEEFINLSIEPYSVDNVLNSGSASMNLDYDSSGWEEFSIDNNVSPDEYVKRNLLESLSLAAFE